MSGIEVTPEERAWKRNCAKLRRRLAREDQYLIITRGHDPLMMISTIQPNCVIAGPVPANPDVLRAWLRGDDQPG